MKRAFAIARLAPVAALLATAACAPLPVNSGGAVYQYDTPYPYSAPYGSIYSDPFFYGPYPGPYAYYGPYGGYYGAYGGYVPPPAAAAPPPPASHAPVAPGSPTGPRPPVNPGPVPMSPGHGPVPPAASAQGQSPVPQSLFRRSQRR